MPPNLSERQQERWIEQNMHLFNQEPEIIGYKWKPCDEKVHWEIEQFYQNTVSNRTFGKTIGASEQREFKKGLGDF